MNTIRLLSGWLCYRAILLLPINLKSPAYCWMLGWAGWYAHGGEKESGNG